MSRARFISSFPIFLVFTLLPDCSCTRGNCRNKWAPCLMGPSSGSALSTSSSGELAAGLPDTHLGQTEDTALLLVCWGVVAWVGIEFCYVLFFCFCWDDYMGFFCLVCCYVALFFNVKQSYIPVITALGYIIYFFRGFASAFESPVPFLCAWSSSRFSVIGWVRVRSCLVSWVCRTLLCLS